MLDAHLLEEHHAKPASVAGQGCGPLLVTGATGFIGSRLALRARDSGLQVRAFGMARDDLERDNIAEMEAAGIDVIVGDATETPHDKLVGGIGTILHLAAAQHEVSISDARFRAVNVEATEALISAAVASGVRRIVYASTIGVWGERSGVMDESTPPSPDNIYGVTKLDAEAVLERARSQIETVIIRVPETFGPADGRLLKLFKMVSKKRVLVIGNGRNLHQPIFVDDLTDLFLRAATHPDAAGETFVAAGPAPVTSLEMLEGAADALDRQPGYLKLPLLPFLGLAHVCEIAFGMLGKHPPIHRRRLGFFTKSQQFDTGKLERVLGFRAATSFRIGAAITASWYLKHGWLPAVVML